MSKQILFEEINTGKHIDIIHPDVRTRLNDPSKIGILDALPADALEYYHLIVSQSYQNMMDRISHYTGIPLHKMNNELPGAMFMAIESINTIKQLEGAHAKYFEDLALDTVLELEEFHFVKQAYHNDKIHFDIKLSHGELQNAISEFDKKAKKNNQPKEDKRLTKSEYANQKFSEDLMQDPEKKLRRHLANALTQGAAVNGLYLFNLVKSKLDAISPRLVSLYGMVCSISQLGYYMNPPNFAAFARNMPDMVAGSEEVYQDKSSKQTRYVIKVRAQIFPVLVHEIIKGIYEYLSLNKNSLGVEKQDTLEDETHDIMAGPELTKKLRSMVPLDKSKYLPVIHQQLLKLPINDIKQVLSGSAAGQKIVQRIISTMENKGR